MKKTVKRYIIALFLDRSKCKFKIKGWDNLSKVYFQDGGYNSSTFTVNLDNAKQYATINNAKQALKAIRFFYNEQLLKGKKADIIEVTVKVEAEIGEVVEQYSF